MDSGAEHIRETRAKILAAKKEIKEYLRLPEDARGLLILTHGRALSKWETVEWNEEPRDDSTTSTGNTLSTEEPISKK
jgi:hypothetical protein